MALTHMYEQTHTNTGLTGTTAGTQGVSPPSTLLLWADCQRCPLSKNTNIHTHSSHRHTHTHLKHTQIPGLASAQCRDYRIRTLFHYLPTLYSSRSLTHTRAKTHTHTHNDSHNTWLLHTRGYSYSLASKCNNTLFKQMLLLGFNLQMTWVLISDISNKCSNSSLGNTLKLYAFLGGWKKTHYIADLWP